MDSIRNATEGKQSNAGAQNDLREADKLPLLELLAEDFETHDRSLLEPGFWAVAVHRLGSRLCNTRLPVLRGTVETTHNILSTAVDWIWGIKLPRTTRLGRRVRIWHCGAIVLNAQSIGNDVHIRQNTTFGSLRTADASRVECLPVIEDGVELGSGACVLGGICLGRGAFVGANSVVLKTVPPGVTVFGVPARIIPT